jgi:hypothetical protein
MNMVAKEYSHEIAAIYRRQRVERQKAAPRRQPCRHARQLARD